MRIERKEGPARAAAEVEVFETAPDGNVSLADIVQKRFGVPEGGMAHYLGTKPGTLNLAMDLRVSSSEEGKPPSYIDPEDVDEFCKRFGQYWLLIAGFTTDNDGTRRVLSESEIKELQKTLNAFVIREESEPVEQ